MMLPLLAVGLSPLFAPTNAGVQTTTNLQAPVTTATDPDATVPPTAFKRALTVPAASAGGSSSLLPPPPEDDCSTPVVIAGAGTFPFDVTMATTGTQGQANSACLIGTVSGIVNDVWYAWTATASGDYSLTTCGLTTIDTKIAVYSGSGCPTGAAIVCSDDTCSPGTSLQTTLTLTAVATQTYMIQLGVYPVAVPVLGTGSFTIAALTPLPCGRIDDGVTENAGGWTAGGEYCWMQSFGTIGQQFTLSQVEVAWGSAAFPTTSPPDGTACRVAVWEDPNDDGNPADAVLLNLVSTTVMNNATGIYNTITLTSPQTINGVFFVGAGMVHAAGQFPMPMDKNGPGASLHRAWRFGNNTATPVDFAVFANNLFPPKNIQTISPAFESCVTVRYVCQTTPGVAMCEPGLAGVMACACGNPNGTGVGCSNTASTGGNLSSSGVASLSADSVDPGTVTLTGSSMFSGSSGVLLQGNALVAAGTTFGAGIRCIGGSLKRMYTKPLSGGGATVPGALDLSISNRSAALVDPIAAASTRWYQFQYRDPSLVNPGGGCPVVATFNITRGQEIVWGP